MEAHGIEGIRVNSERPAQGTVEGGSMLLTPDAPYGNNM